VVAGDEFSVHVVPFVVSVPLIFNASVTVPLFVAVIALDNAVDLMSLLVLSGIVPYATLEVDKITETTPGVTVAEITCELSAPMAARLNDIIASEKIAPMAINFLDFIFLLKEPFLSPMDIGRRMAISNKFDLCFIISLSFFPAKIARALVFRSGNLIVRLLMIICQCAACG